MTGKEAIFGHNIKNNGHFKDDSKHDVAQSLRQLMEVNNIYIYLEMSIDFIFILHIKKTYCKHDGTSCSLDVISFIL